MHLSTMVPVAVLPPYLMVTVLPQSESVMIPCARARTFSVLPSLAVPQALGLVMVVAVS